MNFGLLRLQGSVLSSRQGGDQTPNCLSWSWVWSGNLTTANVDLEVGRVVQIIQGSMG